MYSLQNLTDCDKIWYILSPVNLARFCDLSQLFRLYMSNKVYILEMEYNLSKGAETEIE